MIRIRPDLEKLDLSVRSSSLDDLRASDSGRTVSDPRLPSSVSCGIITPRQCRRGVAIPFGLFKAKCSTSPTGRAVAQCLNGWLASTSTSGLMPPDDPDSAEDYTERFRAELYNLIVNTQPGRAVRKQRAAGSHGTRPLGRGGTVCSCAPIPTSKTWPGLPVPV